MTAQAIWRLAARFAVIAVVLAAVVRPAPGLSSAFTYQGQIIKDGSPVDGTCDLSFKLFEAVSGGSQIGNTQSVSAVSVSDGLFTLQLNGTGDFGAAAFAGQDRWLEIAARCPSGSGSFSAPFAPRQQVTAAPNAIYAVTAGSVPWSGLTGLSCGNGQVAKWSGSQWACADDQNTTYNAGAGLTLSGSTLSIASGGVTSSMIADGTIQTADLGDAQVTNAKIASGIDYTKLSGTPPSLPPNGPAGGSLSGTYPNPSIASGGVTSSMIADGTIQTVDLGDAQVTNAKIASGIDYTKLSGAPSSLPPNGPATGSLSGTYPNPSIASNSVGSAQIQDGSVSSADVGFNYAGSSSKGGPATDLACSGCVSPAEIASGSAGQVLTTTAGGVAWQAGAGWSLTGNSGTTPGTNFLGTTDSKALELKVNGARALRLEPDPTSPNVIGGFSGNTVAIGTFGATIGGGGKSGYEHHVGGNYGTVGGGWHNTAGNFDTVAGGWTNTASGGNATVAGGMSNTASGDAATVAGGWTNTASGTRATVGGGYGNTAGGEHTTVAGGSGNTASGPYAAVGGGAGNRVTDDYGTLGGGTDNQAGDNAGTTSDSAYATVGGGWSNLASGEGATVAGGKDNTAGIVATVAGGANNTASGDVATVAGGVDNTASGEVATVAGGSTNTASGEVATVAGGTRNQATAEGAAVGGGRDNQATAQFGTIGGGGSLSGYPATGNHVTDAYGTVGGGMSNMAGDGAGTTSDKAFATVGGGSANGASGEGATVAGGEMNHASGRLATVPGGQSNTAGGDYSFAAGRRAKANNQGCFVLADATDADETCSSNNRFIFRVTNAFYIYTNAANTTGVYVPAGGGAWAAVSDRNVKENFTPVDGRDVLARLASVPVETWNLKSQPPSIRHIGPMAQDFSAAFSVGEDNTHISTVDADGVALAAIQGLYRIVQEKDAQIAALEARLAALERATGHGLKLASAAGTAGQ